MCPGPLGREEDEVEEPVRNSGERLMSFIISSFQVSARWYVLMVLCNLLGRDRAFFGELGPILGDDIQLSARGA